MPSATADTAGRIDAPPMVIAVAPNGARRGKSDHPALPITAADLADCAARCREAGATVFHLHVRDAHGRHLLDAEAYRQATAAIRRAVNDAMIVQITSEAAGLYGPAEQMAVVGAARPEAVSLSIRELFADSALEAAAADFVAGLHRDAVMIQYILYTPEEVRRFVAMRRQGTLPPGGTALFVLGRYHGSSRSEPRDLLAFLAEWDDPAPWMLCAFGPRENACAMTAAALGGHARVGFENNLHMADGRVAPDNAALAAQLAGGLPLVGRSVADVAAARALMAGGPTVPVASSQGKD